MIALTVGAAIEAAGHEVAARALLEEAALGHGDAGGGGHLGVGVLDPAVGRAVTQVVAVAVHAGRADAVELDEPVLEPGLERGEGREDAIVARMEGDEGLGPRTAGARADLDELLERGVGAGAVGEAATDGEPRGEDELGQVDGAGGLILVGAGGWAELEGTHGPIGDVGQAIEGRDAVLRDVVLGHPRVDERVAEGVGQAVSEQRREVMEGLWSEFRPLGKVVGLGAAGHAQGRELDAARAPLGAVLEDESPRRGILGDRAHESVPDPDLENIHSPVGHSYALTRWRTRRDPRSSSTRRASSAAIGENVCAGGARR